MPRMLGADGDRALLGRRGAWREPAGGNKGGKTCHPEPLRQDKAQTLGLQPPHHTSESRAHYRTVLGDGRHPGPEGNTRYRGLSKSVTATTKYLSFPLILVTERKPSVFRRKPLGP